ncbi:MAG: methyltransferase domain-containing protein [Robiginitomaculum sp.]|nr:methyltransferase domain-containing protein [Robiginitomaculum sp.]
MASVKDIFDTKLIRSRRARGAKLVTDAFLFERCAEDACARVLDINRTFTQTLLIGPPEITDKLTKSLSVKLGKIVIVNFIDDDLGTLPYPDKNFDLVINALDLHSVNNVPRAMHEFMRVLKPDGLFLACLFGGQTLSTLRHVMYEAEDLIYGHITPRVSPMITLSQAAGLLQTAGFTMPVVDRDLVRVNYKSLALLYRDLRRMGESNTLIERAKNPVSIKFFAKVEDIYKRDHTDKASGKLKVEIDIIWLTGWAPDKSQPKPLKPGSATTRLADALGVKEGKL